jgi:hypothetical protein
MLLRQRLMERAKLAAKKAASSLGAVAEPPATPLSALTSLAANQGLDEHANRRAFVEHLLGTEFGDQLLNQAKFQQLVEQVTRVMETDPELSRQMTQVLSSLR